MYDMYGPHDDVPYQYGVKDTTPGSDNGEDRGTCTVFVIIRNSGQITSTKVRRGRGLLGEPSNRRGT